MPLYRSRHWSVTEWDAYRRSSNDYAYDDDTGHLCTDNPQTAVLFQILDMLRDWNKNWVINTTDTHYDDSLGENTTYKSGYRPTSPFDVNNACGGEYNSYHTRGCAADIHIAGQDDDSAALAETIRAASASYHMEDKIGLGCYYQWCHIDTRGYESDW